MKTNPRSHAEFAEAVDSEFKDTRKLIRDEFKELKRDLLEEIDKASFSANLSAIAGTIALLVVCLFFTQWIVTLSVKSALYDAGYRSNQSGTTHIE
jgi:hypothetical protein